LLSYEDIYHAAGILNPPSGYGIQKVVDMLNSERIRDLAKDVKRASVLMALDAAGISLDDLLRDATRRQQALDSYESSRRKQLEEFEAHKSQENAQIEAEIERLRAHYAERIQKNREQVEQEKAALHNWQGAMRHESQRISEVIELCQKQPSALAGSSLPGTTGSNAEGDKSSSEKLAAGAAHA
jgi:DNA anti-recombination protein RmuC